MLYHKIFFNDYVPFRAKCTRFLVDFARNIYELGEIWAKIGGFRPIILADAKVLLYICSAKQKDRIWKQSSDEERRSRG